MTSYRCLLIFFIFPALLHADVLPDAKPEEVGASSSRLDRIDAVVGQSLQRGDKGQ